MTQKRSFRTPCQPPDFGRSFISMVEASERSEEPFCWFGWQVA
jgi:hypothetical protein